ncbi:MAG: zf-HC2 domain-containing protein [Gemmatimonadetes bacterium]|nr:zf-HC2 domain-containing protein [Gemmatimonadota bacterium]
MDHRTDGELQAYLDAELPRDEATGVAEHLMVCTDCRVRLGELRMAGEDFRQALGDLDTQLARPAPAAVLPPRLWQERNAGARRTGFGRRALSRAAILLLVAAGAAAAVVPGSPLRELIERLSSERAEPAMVKVPARPADQSEPPAPGIGSITVAPVEGRVSVSVRQFAAGSTIRVRLGSGPDVRARLLSGLNEARFSVGPGSLFVIGTGNSTVGEILIELPRGLNFATVDVDGKRTLVASPDGLRRPGDPSGVPEDEVVLRVGG